MTKYTRRRRRVLLSIPVEVFFEIYSPFFSGVVKILKTDENPPKIGGDTGIYLLNLKPTVLYIERGRVDRFLLLYYNIVESKFVEFPDFVKI